MARIGRNGWQRHPATGDRRRTPHGHVSEQGRMAVSVFGFITGRPIVEVKDDGMLLTSFGSLGWPDPTPLPS
jgi:hypothetical protein